MSCAIHSASCPNRMLRCRTLRSRPLSSKVAKYAEVASERRQCCYRRLYVVMRREGKPSSIRRTYCVYREEELAVTTVIASPASRDESSARRAIAQPASIREKTNRASVVLHGSRGQRCSFSSSDLQCGGLVRNIVAIDYLGMRHGRDHRCGARRDFVGRSG